MEHLDEITFSWSPMAEQPDFVWATMELLELPWAPEEQKDQGPHGFLADQQFSFSHASADAIEIQMKDSRGHDVDAMIQQYLKEHRADEGDLDECLSGDLHSSPSYETNANHQMEVTKSCSGGTHNFPQKKRGTRKKRMSPWAEFNPYSVTRNDAKATEQTNSNQTLKSYIKQGKLEAFALTLGVWGGHGQRQCVTRKTSLMDNSYMLGFQKPFACRGQGKTRKNNSHWTEDEVKSLLDGLSTYGVGRWTKIKKTFFETSIRTTEHMKNKWRNLTQASGPEVRSKKKVKPLKATQKILQRLHDQIIIIDKKHAAQECRTSRRKKHSVS